MCRQNSNIQVQNLGKSETIALLEGIDKIKKKLIEKCFPSRFEYYLRS